MARAMIPVDRPRLEASLKEAEKDGPLPNLDRLWKATAEIYNKSAKTPITFSVVCLRAKEWNIPVKTIPGKRGRGEMTEEQKAAMAAGRGARKPRSEKMKDFKKTFDLIRADLGRSADKRRFLPLVDAAEGGSLTAAVKLNCLGCSGWKPVHVKECHIESCSFFPHRPYKPGVEEEEGELVAVDDFGNPVDDDMDEAA